MVDGPQGAVGRMAAEGGKLARVCNEASIALEVVVHRLYGLLVVDREMAAVLLWQAELEIAEWLNRIDDEVVELAAPSTDP